MKFRVKVARMSQNGKSAVVTVSQIVKTPFGMGVTQLGIGYVKVDEGTELPTGFEYVHDGSISFQPIVDQNTGIVATTKGGDIKHQISFLEEGVPCVWPVTSVAPVAPRVAIKEEVEEELVVMLKELDSDGNPIPNDTTDPLDPE